MRRALLIVVLTLAACAQREPAVLLNAPPEFHGARVFIDGTEVGELSATHSYRRGVYASTQELSAPPRHEANLAIPELATGHHQLVIVAAGRPKYHASFKTRGAYTEVFIQATAGR